MRRVRAVRLEEESCDIHQPFALTVSSSTVSHAPPGWKAARTVVSKARSRAPHRHKAQGNGSLFLGYDGPTRPLSLPVEVVVKPVCFTAKRQKVKHRHKGERSRTSTEAFIVLLLSAKRLRGFLSNYNHLPGVALVLDISSATGAQ